MPSSVRVGFPGGVRVTAALGNHEIRTDQPAAGVGDDSAPSRFGLFLASCYALRFCQQRGLPTEGLALEQGWERDDSGRISRIPLALTLPDGFPDKYRSAMLRAAGHCAVKKVLADPPEIELTSA